MSLGSPMSDVITTVQCSIRSQLNNKPRVVVTDLGCAIPAVIILRNGTEQFRCHSVQCPPSECPPGHYSPVNNVPPDIIHR